MARHPRTPRSPGRLLPFLLLGLLAGSACTTRTIQPRDPSAGVAPVLSVERFLQAVNDRDYPSMARLFGTADGPVAETGSTFGCAFKKMGSWIGLSDPCVKWVEVESRMAAIAAILRHDDYRIVSERQAPGREDPTHRVGVDLSQGSRVLNDVPFLVVRSDDGNWLVQEIGLEDVTGP